MPHTVYLDDRPVQFTVDDGETVLAAGLRHGLALPYGCRTGGCASCRVHMTQGRVAYPFAPPALSESEIDAGYILMCLAQPRSDLHLALHQPPMLDELRPRLWPTRAISRQWLAHDVIGLTLKLPRGDAPFRYLPGQYVDFLLEGSRRRSFSLANAPDGATLEMHLRLVPGGRFAHWVAHDMPDRAILRFEGPLGAFYVRDDSERPLLFVAGGTGFAPIKGMLEAQLARGLPRPAHLFWGARSRRDLYLHQLAQDWAQQYSGFRYTPVLSQPDADWDGSHGLVHDAVLQAYPDLSGYEVYASGPPVMVHALKSAFPRAGLDADHLYYDSFDYAHETWPENGAGRESGPMR
jgi:CDP-4-dehydro-6-deoxyglucose reductase, E3